MAKIPSTHDGVVKSIKFGNDEICLVGHALIEMEVEDGAASNAPTATAPAAESKKEAATPKQDTAA